MGGSPAPTSDNNSFKPASRVAPAQTPDSNGFKSASLGVDDTMDEVTRHLLDARNKIETVEMEFAQIMNELAAFGQRQPAASTLPTTAPSAGANGNAAAMPEYFCINTPKPHNGAETISPVRPARPYSQHLSSRTVQE